MNDDDFQELVSVLEDAIFKTRTGLEAAHEAADELERRGWRLVRTSPISETGETQ